MNGERFSPAEVERMVSQAERSCGTCAACCSTISVVELGKPQGVLCMYARPGTPGPCSIYPDRPPACRGWYCGWRYGLADEEDRPDRSGAVMVLLRNALHVHMDRGARITGHLLAWLEDRAEEGCMVLVRMLDGREWQIMGDCSQRPIDAEHPAVPLTQDKIEIKLKRIERAGARA